MKKLNHYLLLVGIIISMSSCTFHESLSYNENQQQTSVVLSENNFKVVAKVKGEAKAVYIFGVGGLKNRALIEIAKADMLDKANILGKSRAVINMTSEIHHKAVIFPIYYRKTVIVSGHVVEFKD